MQSCATLECDKVKQNDYDEPCFLPNNGRRFSLSSTISLTDFIPGTDTVIHDEQSVYDSPRFLKTEDGTHSLSRMVQARGDLLLEAERTSTFYARPLLRVSRLIDPSLSDHERHCIISSERDRLLNNAVLEFRQNTRSV